MNDIRNASVLFPDLIETIETKSEMQEYKHDFFKGLNREIFITI